MERDWAGVAAAVKNRRVALGMRQKELAEAAGYDASTIRNIETQARPNFDPVTLSNVSRALGRDPGWLDAIARREVPSDDMAPPADARRGDFDDLPDEDYEVLLAVARRLREARKS